MLFRYQMCTICFKL